MRKKYDWGELTEGECRDFLERYANVLEDTLSMGRTQRTLNDLCVQDVLEFMDLEAFNKIYSCASQFPDIGELRTFENSTYQATAFIGYLRGSMDMLDVFSRTVKDSMSELKLTESQL